MSGTVLATVIGSVSIVLWGALALLTQLTGGAVPPLQLLAMTFSLAFVVMLLKWSVRGESPQRYLRQPWYVWLVGIGGLAGYHLAYFIALRHAPVVEASLIAYLWPLLIVLFSALLPGERLHVCHVLGAVLAFVGCWLLIGGQHFAPEFLAGYIAAASGALIWSGYSVLSRRLKAVPTDTVGWFCGATALLAWAGHGMFEVTAWPATWGVWAGVVGLGIGPVGIAFFTWDYGIKHGDIQLLGTLSYAAPLLSTLLLILAGQAEASWQLFVACVAITGGAVLAGVVSRGAGVRG